MNQVLIFLSNLFKPRKKSKKIIPDKKAIQKSSNVDVNFISTTAVGRELKIPQKEIIDFFITKGLLKRINKKLTLTPLGEDYNGKIHYSGSDSWVVWPTTIVKEPFIKEIVEKNFKQFSDPITSNLQNKIFFYGKYHPYRHGTNPEFDDFSARLLDLKSDENNAVEYFFNLLKDLNFDNTEVIVIVPSHNPDNKMSPVKKLAMLLAEYKNWTDATDSIVRTHKINKLAYGGDRSLSTQLNSLTVKNKHLLINKNVLVFDDVTTSGNSLYATMKLLHKINIKSTWAYAVAHTE